MKRVIIFLTMLILSCGFCFAEAADTVPSLGKIEKSIFGFDYKNEDVLKRIERLELHAYGAASQSPKQQRIDKLTKDLPVNESEEILRQAYNKKEDLPESDNTVKYPIVDVMEKMVFNKVDEKADIYGRVTKLEQKIFNKVSQKTLNERVDILRTAIVPSGTEEPAEKDSLTMQPQQYENNKVLDYGGDNYYNSKILSKNSLGNQLSAIEKQVFRKIYPSLTAEQRLSQLEQTIFKHDFSQDEETMRLQRISAAFEAKKTSGQYDSNKIGRNMATGMQIASFLLMILAIIL